jgi:carbonic anhydrase
MWIGTALLVVLSLGLEEGIRTPPPPWGYDRPSDWGGICTSGNAQSPIYINTTVAVAAHPHLAPVILTSKCRFLAGATKVQVESNYRTVEVRLPATKQKDGAWPCAVVDPNSGELYPFVRFHFHIGPEHVMEKHGADAELHAVFQQPSGKTLVVGTRLRAASRRDKTRAAMFFDATLGAPLPKSGEATTTKLKEDVGLDDVFPTSDGTYDTYVGSLTTPPCTEGVRWIVFSATQDIPSDVFQRIRSALDSYMPVTFDKFSNARNPQPLNGRLVLKYHDPTSTSLNRWVISEEEESKMTSVATPALTTTIASSTSDALTHHGLLIGIIFLCLVAIGLYLRLRENPVEVGISDSARAAATYGTMET